MTIPGPLQKETTTLKAKQPKIDRKCYCPNSTDLCFNDMNKLYFCETSAFRHKIRLKSPLRSGIVFASSEVVHRPGHHCSLLSDNKNIQQTRLQKANLLSAAMLKWSRQDCIGSNAGPTNICADENLNFQMQHLVNSFEWNAPYRGAFGAPNLVHLCMCGVGMYVHVCVCMCVCV